MPKDRRLRDDIADSVAEEMKGGMSKVPAKPAPTGPTMDQSQFTRGAEESQEQKLRQQAQKATLLRKQFSQ